MSLEAGSVYARLSGLFQSDGFDKYDAALGKARDKSKTPVEAKLKAAVDETGFTRFGQKVDAMKRADATATLKADTGDATFKVDALRSLVNETKQDITERKKYGLEVGGAVAELKVLQAELRKTEREAARVRLFGGGSPGGGGGGGGRTGRGGLFGPGSAANGGAFGAPIGIGWQAGAIGAGGLLGSPLIGSAGAGILGAGVLGSGVLATAVTGLGALAAVAKPAAANAKQVSEAYTSLLIKTKQYGEGSTQAETAQKKLNAVMELAGPAASKAGKAAVEFGNAWSDGTQKSQRSVNRLTASLYDFARTQIPLLDKLGGQAADSLRTKFLAPIEKVLGSREMHRIFGSLGDEFERVSGPLGHAAGDFILAFGRLAQAAEPYVTKLAKGIEDFADHLVDLTGNKGKLDGFVKDVVGQFQSWWRLTKDLGKLLFDFFGMGRKQGQGMVDSLDQIIRRWDRWIRSAKGKNAVGSFFSDAKTLAEALGSSLSPVVGMFVQITRSLLPAMASLAKSMAPAIQALADIFAAIGTALSNLVESSPALRLIITGLATAAAAWTGVKFLGAITGVTKLIGLMKKLRTASAEAALAEEAVGAGAGGGVSRLLGRRGGGRAVGAAEGAAEGAAGAGAVSAASRLKGLGGGLLKGLGKKLVLFDVGVNLIDSRGNPVATVVNTAHDLTFGLVPKLKVPTGDERADKHIADLGRRLEAAIKVGDTSGIRRITKELTAAAAEARKFARVDLAGTIDKLSTRGTKSLNDLITHPMKALRRASPAWAASFEDMRKDAGKSMGTLQGDMRHSLAVIAGTFKKGSQEAKDATALSFRQMIRSVDKSMDSGKVSVKDGMAAIRRYANKDTGAAKEIVADNFQAAARAIRHQMDRGKVDVDDGLRKINRLMTKAFEALGISPKSARNLAQAGLSVHDITHAAPEGSAGGGSGQGHIPRNATGGIPNPMASSQDDHLVLGPDGRPVARISGSEGIVNTPQMGVIDRALGVARMLGAVPYGSLGELWGSGMRHYAEGGPLRRLARGGGMVRVPGDPNTTGGRDRVAASIVSQVAPWIRRYHADIGYAFDPGGGHKSPGHNVTGTATDVYPAGGGSWNLLERGLRVLVNAGKTVYYGTHGIGIPLAGHGRGNHAHIEWASGGQAALAHVDIKAPRSGLRGPLGALINAGLGVAAKGAERYVNRKAASAADAGMPGGAAAAPAGRVRTWLAQALRLTGHYSAANLNALFSRAMQESGGNPRAQNNWDSNARAGHPSKGLLQTIDSTFNAYALRGHHNIWNPVDNAAAAIRYMFAQYGHIVGASGTGYAKGGLLRRFFGGGLLPAFKRGGRPRATGRGSIASGTNRGPHIGGRNPFNPRHPHGPAGGRPSVGMDGRPITGTSAPEAIDPAMLTPVDQTVLDFIDQRYALAQVDTPDDVTDDKQWLGAYVTFWTNVLGRLRSDPSSQASWITNAADNLRGARDALKQANDTGPTIAEQVREQLSQFDSAQQALFQGFGSNFVPTAAIPNGAPLGGFRQFGAAGAAYASDAGLLPGGGSGKLVYIGEGGSLVTQHYPAAPDDPHTQAQTSRFAFESAF